MGHAAAEASSGVQALRLLQKQRLTLPFWICVWGARRGLICCRSLLAGARPRRRRRYRLRHHRFGRGSDAARRLRLSAQTVHARSTARDAGSLAADAAASHQVADLQEQVRAGTPKPIWRQSNRRWGRRWTWRFRRRPARRRCCCAARAARARASGTRHALPQPAAGGPFVTVHCPSLSAELLESELFGHVKGAFTGRRVDTTGKAAAAEGGTLFLDEIADLPLSVQPKLLRLVQDKAYERSAIHGRAW